jgi:FkbM family methyltransferase
MTSDNIFSFQSYKNMPFVKKLFFWTIDNSIRLFLPKQDKILSCNGMKLLVINPSQNLMGRSVYLSGVWEKKATRYISKKIRPGMRVMDVGASTGYYTVLFAKLVGETGRVLSFEPIPRAGEYVEKNIEINQLKNVDSFKFALFDKSGSACLEDPFRNDKIDPDKKTATENDIIVEMVVFDELRKKSKIGRIDVAKIDVEGAELNVLKGMENTLKTDKPGLLIEVHPSMLKSFHHTHEDLMDYLTGLGYQCKPVDRPVLDFSKRNITVYFHCP